MSDNWLTVIPNDLTVVLDEEALARALATFKQIAPEAEVLTIHISDTFKFFDCGGNLERIVCPACHADIAMEWWRHRMDEDHEEGLGFRLLGYPTPCCGHVHTLHDLCYDWPQGIARFALEAKNPGIDKLGEATLRELERLLGTQLRVIYRHL
jgi:hypothetical protein